MATSPTPIRDPQLAGHQRRDPKYLESKQDMIKLLELEKLNDSGLIGSKNKEYYNEEALDSARKEYRGNLTDKKEETMYLGKKKHTSNQVAKGLFPDLNKQLYLVNSYA